MNCSLCKKNINKYSIDFNHLDIDENHSVEICSECFDKIVNWQKNIYATLFPTKTIKKMVGKK